jgi:hypothetical protein
MKPLEKDYRGNMDHSKMNSTYVPKLWYSTHTNHELLTEAFKKDKKKWQKVNFIK